MSKKNLLITAVVLLAVVAMAGYWFWGGFPGNGISGEGATTTFTSTENVFSFQYPGDWKAYQEELVLTSWSSDSAQVNRLPDGEGVIVIETFAPDSAAGQKFLVSPSDRASDALPLWLDDKIYPPVVASSVIYFNDQHDRELAEAMGFNSEQIGLETQVSVVGITITDGHRLYHVAGIQNGSGMEKRAALDVVGQILATWDFKAATVYD
jgi:hypothetical protein